MSKIALLCYHKNADKIYEKKWIDDYRESIIYQTYKEFEIYEMNYGGDSYRIFENSYFESVEMPTFVHALNYLLDKCFSSGYDFVANSNCDDVYSFDRLEKQLPYSEQGYEIVSGNFALLKDDSIIKYHKFHEMNIVQELSKNHNIIAHPLVIYAASFWRKHRYVPEECPFEDMYLWQRAVKNSGIIILENNLLYHRIHNNAVCRSDNK